jgi:hypothetical protein
VVHPLDVQEFAQKLSIIRTVSLGMIVVLTVVSFGFALVVFYALDGVPLAGNRFTVEGIAVPALVALAVTPLMPILAFVYGRKRRAAALAKMLTDHPEVVGEEADTERLLNAFAGGQFAESAMLFGTGLTWAILFHVISSPIVLGCIGFLVVVLAVRFPFSFRVKSWFDAELANYRNQRATSSGTPPR